MKQLPEIFAYPTESFYALGADATDKTAIQQLFRVKQREKNKPMAVIAADLAQVREFFYFNQHELRLAKKFWPGPLTIVLRPKASTTPASGHPSSGRRGFIAARALSPLSGGGTERGSGARRIGVRVPRHTGARRLAKRMGAPITATSANISGQPPTTSLHKVKRNFPGILVMPGKCGGARQPSTVVAIRAKKLIVLRPGAIHEKSLYA